MPTNGDMKRWYPDIPENKIPHDFVRLNEDGKIPSDILPSYVDDVIEGYYYSDEFYEDSNHTKKITPEKSKIYLDIPTNRSYRWGGTQYVLIGDGNTKYYQHNIRFSIDVQDASSLAYCFSIISSDSTQITSSTILSVLFDLYGIANFVGGVSGSGDNNYANPIGIFTAHCGSTGNNLNLYTPAFIDDTITISDVDHTLSRMIVNHIGEVIFDTLSDTVVAL